MVTEVAPPVGKPQEHRPWDLPPINATAPVAYPPPLARARAGVALAGVAHVAHRGRRLSEGDDRAASEQERSDPRWQRGARA